MAFRLCHNVGALDLRISRLYTCPICSPVNASSQRLLPATHDSGPNWLARPCLYGTFTHYHLPALTGARHTTLYQA